MIKPLLLTGIMLAFASQAQEMNGAEHAPHTLNTPMPGAKALWDVQHSFDATTAANGSMGLAGVAYVNNEIWASLWASDTIIRYSSTGTLIDKINIAGLSGTRSITTDGTSLYMGNNTNTITIVNPSTQVVTGTITSAASVTSRFLTYDPTLDGGNGGFWTGNFSTDIVSISMSGTVLSTIPAATHTLTGMYGAAYDGATLGGPYLWVYDQGGSNSSQLVALQLPAGTLTGLTHDVFTDIGPTLGVTSSLAGGAFFSSNYYPGQNSIMVISQGSPVNTFIAYDTDNSVVNDDVAVTQVRPTQGYTQVPKTQTFNETFEISYSNLSTAIVDTLYANVEYYFNGGLLSSETLSATNVAIASNGTLTSSLLAMDQGVGQYDVKVNVYPNAALSDNTSSNDSLTFSFAVTDSVFARDNGISTGTGYTVSAIDSAYAMSLFELINPDTITGIIIVLEPSAIPDGDTTFGLIYDYNGTLPTMELARGIPIEMNASQNEYYLQFTNEVILPAGVYAFGCYEPDSTGIGLMQSSSVYTSGTNYYFTSANNWSASNIQTARGIHPVVKYHASGAGLNDLNTDNFLLYPNPTNGMVMVDLAENKNVKAINVLDLNGRLVYEMHVDASISKIEMDLQSLDAGTYFINILGDTFTSVKQLNKQ